MERVLLERMGDAAVKDKGPCLSARSLSILMAIGVYAPNTRNRTEYS